ncbi:MAG: hypothetical protein ACFE9V_12385 [Candidatus Hodarchaeota archaeon]
MSETGFKIFKLNFDGSFDEVSYENIKDVFTIVNILAIYISQKKTMYIWIGSNATQALKNHISNIRVLVKEEFPDFRIIRNFTFEMREEPFEFFKNLNISKEELYKIIDYQEKIMLPALRKIDSLRTKLEDHIGSEDYPNAIKTSEEIMVLANKIEDNAVLTEQKRLIIDIKSKNEDKKIVDKLLENASSVEEEFSKLIESKQFLKAHQLVEEFEKKFSSTYDLSQIPTVEELLSREKKIWKNEQDRLIKVLNKLETDLFLALKNLEIEKANNIMGKGKVFLLDLINDDVKLKWEGFENEIQTTKQKAELINVCDDFINEYAKLKEDFQFNTITRKLNELLKRVQNLEILGYKKKLEDIKKEINVAEESYNKKLAEIAELEKKIKSTQKNNLIDETLRNCQSILKLIKSINKSDLEERYSLILSQTEEVIENRRIFEEKQKSLKKELNQLNKEIHTSLKCMDIAKAGEIIIKSKFFLSELVDDKIKENWNKLEKNFYTAKDLVHNVENLGREGILALESKSYKECLIKYEEIISLIQGYNKKIQEKVG